MDHHLTGPFWGNIIIITLASVITVGCFLAAFWMLMRPGESDSRHPKYTILRDDP